jgi:hypothetical protein
MTRLVIVGSLLALCALFALSPRAAEAQQLVVEMTPGRIEEAIQLGANEKAARKFLEAYVVQNRAGWGNGPLIGSVSTPFARVVLAALAARKADRPFGAADVTSELIAPELHVIATSQKAFGDDTELANVQTLTIIPRDSTNPGDAIRPVRTTELTKDYRDLYGVVPDRPGIVAVFPLSVARDNNDIQVTFDRTATGSSASTRCKACVVPFPVNRIR